MQNEIPPSITAKTIEGRILLFRGHKVMLDSHLAELYELPTRSLNQAVQRNLARFPADFMFQLTEIEIEFLRSQFVILKPSGQGQHFKYKPYVFTEQGVAMLSAVLKSQKAVRVSIEIMRVFVRLRQIICTNKDLARKLAELERHYDSQFKVVFDAIRQLMNPAQTSKRKIGFETD